MTKKRNISMILVMAIMISMLTVFISAMEASPRGILCDCGGSFSKYGSETKSQLSMEKVNCGISGCRHYRILYKYSQGYLCGDCGAGYADITTRWVDNGHAY